MSSINGEGKSDNYDPDLLPKTTLSDEIVGITLENGTEYDAYPEESVKEKIQNAQKRLRGIFGISEIRHSGEYVRKMIEMVFKEEFGDGLI